MALINVEECRGAISRSIDQIIEECRCVLGSELHYQAMIYHVLRVIGHVPINQLGMNVKTSIENPQTNFLKNRLNKKNKRFQSGIEIIPDITIYTEKINSDWRRRNYKNTLRKTLYSLEVKASERYGNRINKREVQMDIEKLMAQRTETYMRHKKEIGIGVLIVDIAPEKNERMKKDVVQELVEVARLNNVDFWYFNNDEKIVYSQHAP